MIILTWLVASVAMFIISNDYEQVNTTMNGISQSSSGQQFTGGEVTSSNQQKIMKYFVAKGLDPAAAAGITANLAAESGCEPRKIQGGGIAKDNYVPVPGIGFGLPQWTTEGNQRAFVAYAKSVGKPVTDMQTQLDFIWLHMEDKVSFPDLLDRLKSIRYTVVNGLTGPMRAAILFHGTTAKIQSHPVIASVNPSRGYEASGDSARRIIDYRCRLAEEIYQNYMAQFHK